MTIYDLEKIELTKRLPKDKYFWYNNLWGIVLTSTFTIPFIFIAIQRLFGVALVTYLAIILFLGLILYRYWRDMAVTFVSTKQEKTKNLKLILEILHDLKWEFHRTSDFVKVWTPNQTFLRRQIVDIQIYIYDRKIGYTFRYSPTIRTGHLIFMFGVRTYLRRKFEKKLRATKAIT